MILHRMKRIWKRHVSNGLKYFRYDRCNFKESNRNNQYLQALRNLEPVNKHNFMSIYVL